MSRRRWVSAAMATALVSPLLVITTGGPVSAAPADKPNLRSKHTVKETGRTTSAKGSTSRLARTDQSLLNQTGTNPVTITVKLDYDSISTYTGGVKGFAATSPSVTGRPLSKAAAEQAYENRIVGIENKFLGDLSKVVPGAKVGQKLRTVYGGIALTVPANEVNDIVKIKGVVAVQKDAVQQPLTDASADFTGASALYGQFTGGKPQAGKGVIFGSIDSGVWPEHPSFADNGNLGAPPAKADGTPRTCDFGDNPLTPASDVFACNNKLIGGQAFLATYNANNPPEMYSTARDSNGHGTHTATTAAGNPVASATVFGVERGPVNGTAPGAWVSAYKVCGIGGCYSSDSAAAVQQAILDGVKVINFSISGGTSPYTDMAELAFLDAYAAGVFVAASAGNNGPGAATTGHQGPWVTTVAASTQKRQFDSTLTVSSTDGATATFTGSSITAGAGQAPVVLASAVPYNDILCSHPAPAGIFVGKIVVCQRGGTVNGQDIGRVQKGFNVVQGGAVGMILYNPTLADTETDNHFLPTVHLADGTAFRGFVDSHPGITAQFTAGQKATGPGDVMAAFSSRGPAAADGVIKPDITAPGVQILAGNTPTPDDLTSGPAGQYYQAIAGTSMSAPQVAGSALLIKALHPDWTPGQVKSALMTTATTKVVKEDTTTPADPFDMGAGRIQVNVANNPGLTFDETADRMAALGNDPLNAVHLNIPSVNAPVMPGKVTTTRTAKNVTNRTQVYLVQGTAPSGTSITVTPPVLTVAPGASVQLTITIRAVGVTGQKFGQVTLNPVGPGTPTLHLPVAFVPQQGDITLAQTCTPGRIALLKTSTCTITAENNTFADTTADFTTTPSLNLPITAANGATVVNPFQATKNGVPLAGKSSGVPTVAPGVSPAGYIPLDAFGVAPTPIGDEQMVRFDVPPFKYNGLTYTWVQVDSNGYLIPGGSGAAEDNNCCNLTQIPDPAAPNNILAPFWTDLDGGGAPGIFATVLTDGVNSWIVVEWRVNVFGTSSERRFQIWMGVNGAQDISFTYDPATLAPPFGQPFLIGAENASGTGGNQLPLGTMPTGDLVVTSTDPTPGAKVSYTVTVKGLVPGNGAVTTSMTSPAVLGTTVVTSTVAVALQPGRQFD